MADDQSNNAVFKLAEKFYDDALSPALREASKIGVDAVKIFRMALFPLQYGAAIQDRLERYITNAFDKVPEENRIAPVESLALPITEKLKYQEEENPVSALYVNLLARAMDKERVLEAHPAFIFIISQLAPAEIEILEIFNACAFRILYIKKQEDRLATKAEVDEYFSTYVPEVLHEMIQGDSYNYDHIRQPEIFLTLIEHLYTLGLICYEPNFLNMPIISSFYWQEDIFSFYPLEITGFGRMFYNACIKE